jgi:hypothetical protein
MLDARTPPLAVSAFAFAFPLVRSAQATSFFNRLLARYRNLLEQSAKVFPLKQAVVVLRRAVGGSKGAFSPSVCF